MQHLAARDSRLLVLRAPALPRGWTGKAHACWIGAGAVPAEVEWLCFLDADVRGHPLLLASAIDVALSREIDLLSLAPRQEMLSFAERLIFPCGLYLLAVSQNLERIQAPGCPEAVATGQFMLLRRTAYDAVGGHASVCGSLCEDVELARRVKSRGYRVIMQDGSELLSVRMYTGWRTLWPGLAKNLSQMLGGTLRTLLIASAAVTIAWTAVLLPIIEATSCARAPGAACIAVVPASLGAAAVLILHVAGAVHFRIPIWYGLLFPVGYAAGALIALDSLRWHLTGRIRWKGRVYP
jgi:chlorobactene glucosyltransferase